MNIFTNPLGKTEGIFYLKPLLLCFFFGCASFCFSQPIIKIKESKKNFGYVKRGEVVKNDYEISNVGTAPLIITDIEISCSCTSAEFPKQPIVPGQTATVSVIFNTKTVYGRQDRVVYLKSNDPKGPHKLRYKGTVSNN